MPGFDFPNNPTTGQIITMPTGAVYRWDGTKWAAASPAGPVTSFNTRTGAVVLGTTDVTAALGYTPYDMGNPAGYQTSAQVATALASYAPLAAPTFTGDARAVTPTPGDNDTSIATTAFVQAAIAAATPAGMPIVLTSTGAVTLTGIVAETNMLALRIPANSLGKNGVVEIKGLFSYTNSAGNKIITLRWSAASGAVSGGLTGTATTVTTTAAAQAFWAFRNNNATNSQQMFNPSAITPFAAAAPAIGTLALDTTADSYLNFNGTVANAGDTLTLAHVYAVVFPHG